MAGELVSGLVWTAVVVESGKFDWGQTDKFPSMTAPEPAYHGLRFYENFGDFAFTTKATAKYLTQALCIKHFINRPKPMLLIIQ